MSSDRYKQLLDEAWDLHVRKNAGYAGADNPDPWANFRMSEAFGVSALDGCLVRMSDKYIRVTNLRRDPTNEQIGEALRDTLRDLAAYALIAVCLLDEQEQGYETGDPLSPANLAVEYGVLRCDHGVPVQDGSVCFQCHRGGR
jgi:hypothetical protein